MNKQKLIERLEDVIAVEDITASSKSSFNERLMKSHYLLAKLYIKEGNAEVAYSHFAEAKKQFDKISLMLDTLRSVNPVFVQDIRRDYETYKKSVENFKETESPLVKKFNHYAQKMINLGFDLILRFSDKY